MEEQKNTQEENIQEESQEQPQGMTSRSYMLQMLAGAYLLYTGYRLCKNVLDGVDGASWGFFAAGVVFVVIGCVMLFVGVRGTLRKDKEKKAEEAAASVEQQIPESTKNTQQSGKKALQTEKAPEGAKKPMSIAERARLASHLEDSEGAEEATEADMEAGTEEAIEADMEAGTEEATDVDMEVGTEESADVE